jgi:hypothetical protein
LSLPDFTRAEYDQPHAMEGEVVRAPGLPAKSGLGHRFALALLYGAIAAALGAVGYAMVGLTGFMVSIVAIGMAWLIAKAMMTASDGIGGRVYQVVAVTLTYFSVSLGELLHPLWLAHAKGLSIFSMFNPIVLKYLLFGPFLELADGFNGILGAIILAIGLRTAWQLAAGCPGFSRGGNASSAGTFGLH